MTTGKGVSLCCQESTPWHLRCGVEACAQTLLPPSCPCYSSRYNPQPFPSSYEATLFTMLAKAIRLNCMQVPMEVYWSMRNKLSTGIILFLLISMWSRTVSSADFVEGHEAAVYSPNGAMPTASVSQPPILSKVNSPPVNPKATEAAVALKNYLNECYGTVILSGQYANGAEGPEVQAIYSQTGKYPAILGFDFLYYGRTAEANKQVRDDSIPCAIDWWQRGGIVTFCWHWLAPKDNHFSEGLPWNKGFYAETTQFSVQKALSGQDPEGYEMLLDDIDTISAQLLILQRAGIPVLWRPLHEAAGGWFWWGAEGPEIYKQLWRLMYDRMVHVHGLNNLLWVWNGQYSETDAMDAWYPGDDVVDIIGEDIYPNKRDHSSQSAAFRLAQTYTKKEKIVALTETGVIPDIDLLLQDGSMWAWFCGWYREYVVNMPAGYQQGLYSDEYTASDVLIKTYQHERVVTLDNLPSFGSLSASVWVQMGYVGWSGFFRLVLSALVLVVSAWLIFFVLRKHKQRPQNAPTGYAFTQVNEGAGTAQAEPPKAAERTFIHSRFLWFQKIKVHRFPYAKAKQWISSHILFHSSRNPPKR